PWPPFDPDYVEDHRRMGTTLAATAAKVAETLEFSADATLDWRIKRLALPIREVPPEELAQAEELLRRHPEPTWAKDNPRQIDPAWMAAASVYSVHLQRQRQPTLEYEIQALRLGDVAIVGLPGEPFVELGLQIKMSSPARLTYIAHCTSQYVGYIPTAEALARGGHEVNLRYWAKLVPEAAEMIVTGALEALDELFG
ncbi:MAG: hypothetical protein J7M26_10385, partial [Armatimonadetes bacterium]|nr:hypothetical protein [Armatimonadota bacterium]